MWWPVLISGLLHFRGTLVLCGSYPSRISLRIHHNGKSTA